MENWNIHTAYTVLLHTLTSWFLALHMNNLVQLTFHSNQYVSSGEGVHIYKGIAHPITYSL